MNELVVIDESQLTVLTNEELFTEFQTSLALTVQHIQKMAVIWKILTERGVDLSKWKKGLMEFLPQIASGRLLPEVLTEYAGHRNLILTMSRIPAEKQRELIDVGVIQKLDITSNDQEIISDVKLDSLRNADIALLFKEDNVRDINEQRIYLLKNSVSPKKEAKTKRKTFRKMEINGKYLELGDDSRVVLDNIIDKLSELYNITPK